MSDSRKTKLINLGAEDLADALIELSVYSARANDLIEQMIASPEENIKRLKKKLANMGSSMYGMDWRDSSRLVQELEMFLQDLAANVTDPLTGIELVVAFYESDEEVMELCDDSDGNVGDMFCYDARRLFIEYASRYEDKEKIADIVLELLQKDNYGVRDSLIDFAAEYLPEKTIRTMIAKLQKRADREKEEYEKRHYLSLIESLAQQIKDAKLFEKTCLASREKLSTTAFIDIARIYLESGDIEAAHSWIVKIPEDESYLSSKRDELLSEIYRKQNNTEKLTELLYKDFRSYHSTETLKAYLDIVGNDRRNDILADEVTYILDRAEFLERDAEFLISIGQMDAAENYLLKHADQMNGNFYGSLLPLAEAMESEKRYLVASLIYRSLLISILKRGYTKAYPYGVLYLRKLDRMATTILDWGVFHNHEIFKAIITQDHGRKHSFWSKYRGEN